MNPRERSLWLRYGAAPVAVAVAVLLRLALLPVLGLNIPFLLLWPAVLFAAWYGGKWPGLFATFLSALTAMVWLMRPHGAFFIAEADDVAGMVLFVLLGSALSFLMERVHQANRRVRSLLATEREAHREAEAAHKQVDGILESITDGFVALDRDWRFTFVNAEAERLYHMSRGELLSKSQWQVFPATLGTRFEAEFRRAVAEKCTVQFEHYYKPWGKWFEVKAYPARDGGLTFYFHDVTAHKRLEDELQRKNEQLQEADRHKDNFLALLAHELRNPLTPLRNTLEILAKGE